jgi:hypothetical protein
MRRFRESAKHGVKNEATSNCTMHNFMKRWAIILISTPTLRNQSSKISWVFIGDRKSPMSINDIVKLLDLSSLDMAQSESKVPDAVILPEQIRPRKNLMFSNPDARFRSYEKITFQRQLDMPRLLNVVD